MNPKKPAYVPVCVSFNTNADAGLTLCDRVNKKLALRPMAAQQGSAGMSGPRESI
jgi:hypothetical protein